MCDIYGFLLYFLMLISLQFSILKKNYLLLSIVLFFVIIIAAYRGTAGVDTSMYIMRFNGTCNFKDIPLIEFITPFIMWIAKYIGFGFGGFSIILGIFVGSLYLYIFKKIPGAIYFGLAMFPVIYIDSLFNGLRIGIAYPIIFLAIYYSSFILFVLSFFSHVSSLLALPFIQKIPFQYLALILIGIVGYITMSHINILDLLSERYISKFYRYQDMSTKNIYSGMADSTLLYTSLVIYLRALEIKGKSFVKKSIMIFVAISFIHIFLISKFVFMLRIVRLYDIAIFALIAKNTKKIDKFSLYLSFIIGILYLLNFLRQINSTCNYEIGGFLPLNFGLF